MKFRFIDAEKGNFPIGFMCEQLEVSRSGFYASRSREASSRAKDEAKLIEEVKAVHAESRGTYGGPRVHEALKQRGRATSRKRVARVMREQGLVARCKAISAHHRLEPRVPRRRECARSQLHRLRS